MKWLVVGTLTLLACSFEAQPAAPTAAAPDPDPAQPTPTDPTHGNPQPPPVAVDKIVNLAAADSLLGTGDLTLGSSEQVDPEITIDTGGATPAIAGIPLPTGVTFTVARQDGTGPELAVLHARLLVVQRALKVTGPRPLVIVCDTIQLSTPIEVVAHSTQPRDAPRGPGALTGDASGAVEIFAHTQIAVSGGVSAGDLGAGFGPPGGGRRSGGVLVVQSPSIEINGWLRADKGDDGRGGIDGQIYWVSSSPMKGDLDPRPTTVAAP